MILDRKTFLPNAMEVYPPGWNGRGNKSRTAYVFYDRQVNDPLHRSQKFFGRFISPKTPLGWKKIVENFNEPAARPVIANAPDANGQAKRQAQTQKR